MSKQSGGFLNRAAWRSPPLLSYREECESVAKHLGDERGGTGLPLGVREGGARVLLRQGRDAEGPLTSRSKRNSRDALVVPAVRPIFGILGNQREYLKNNGGFIWKRLMLRNGCNKNQEV